MKTFKLFLILLLVSFLNKVNAGGYYTGSGLLEYGSCYDIINKHFEVDSTQKYGDLNCYYFKDTSYNRDILLLDVDYYDGGDFDNKDPVYNLPNYPEAAIKMKDFRNKIVTIYGGITGASGALGLDNQEYYSISVIGQIELDESVEEYIKGNYSHNYLLSRTNLYKSSKGIKMRHKIDQIFVNMYLSKKDALKIIFRINAMKAKNNNNFILDTLTYLESRLYIEFILPSLEQ